MVTALFGLVALAAALANVLLVAALLGPFADRLDANGGHLGVWLALGASLLVALIIPLLLARSVIHRQRELKREPRTGPVIGGTLLLWSVLIAGLVWIGAPQPLPRFFAEHGNWLTSRLWTARSARQSAPPAPAPAPAPVAQAAPSDDDPAFAEARATLARFVKATTTLELEPELSSPSAAAMGARWLQQMHALFMSLWSEDPELSAQFQELFDTWEIAPAMLAQPAKVADTVAADGRAFLDDVNDLYVALSGVAKNPIDKPAPKLAIATDALQARRVNPTTIELYNQQGAITLLLEEGLWRVHLAPADKP
jgi:hypothetical protein